MNLAKISFKIDLDNDVQVKLAKQFMSDLKGTSGKIPVVTAAVSDVRTKVIPAEEKEETAQTKPEVKKSDYLDKISRAVAAKVGAHRETIKSKLSEYGVNKAGELEVGDMPFFLEFVESL